MANPLLDFFTTMFDECQERGMALPYLVAAVALNGSCYVLRVPGHAQDPVPLAQHTEAKGFKLPINIMIVDANGEAARAVLTPKGPVWH
jgi:hypothetical protein